MIEPTGRPKYVDVLNKLWGKYLHGDPENIIAELADAEIHVEFDAYCGLFHENINEKDIKEANK